LTRAQMSQKIGNFYVFCACNISWHIWFKTWTKILTQNGGEMTVVSVLCKVWGSHTSSAEDLTLLACGTIFGLGVAKVLKDCNALEMSATAHLKVLPHITEDLNLQPLGSIKGSVLSELQN